MHRSAAVPAAAVKRPRFEPASAEFRSPRNLNWRLQPHPAGGFVHVARRVEEEEAFVERPADIAVVPAEPDTAIFDLDDDDDDMQTEDGGVPEVKNGRR